MEEIFIKRIYDPFDENDGKRILIDRLWPRGISKEVAKISMWAKEIAPTSDLRKWFSHKPELFEEFKQRYLDELRTEKQKIQLVTELCYLANEKKITLLYGAKNPIYNHAVVVKEEIDRKLNFT
jgi:uncharacterized protein YeaO (DUF488 family)